MKKSVLLVQVNAQNLWIIFQEGVVIVDSPGFGEHGKNCGLVERYLSRACGIIYVINTASAGGVDSGRVRQ